MQKFFSKALLVSALASSLLYAGEFEYGAGTFSIEGGFVGLSGTIDSDVTTYTLKEQHKNIASKNYFYSYSITWYDSDKMTQAQNTLNSAIGTLNTAQNSVTIPSYDHTLQGIDANIAIGYDTYHKNENQFFGIGLLVGASFPWIETNDNDDDDTNDPSDTELLTFKVGPTFAASYAFNKYLMAYGTASIAYQYGSIKNDKAGVDSSVDGVFYEADVGIKFQPVSVDYEVTSWLTISPRLYFTAGYRYSNWDVNDVSIDLSGSGITQSQDMTLNSSIGYVGIGYDFF